MRTYYDMYRKFKHGAMVMIKKNDTAVAGSLISFKRDCGNLHYLGITEGNMEYVKEGIMPALYYYPFEFMHAQGYRKINVGATAPFLTTE